MHIGFIGIGNMGEPVVHNLLDKGFTVSVHDIVRERAARVVEKGAVWAQTPAAAAAEAEAVVTSLPGPPQLRTVVEGPDGLLETMRPGTAWIDMSTSDRHQTERLAAQLAERSVATIEAGCTGGVDAAWEGHVTLYIGAAEEHFERWKPVIDGLGDRIFHMGPLGAGMATKLITNLLCFTQQTALAEGLTIGALAGLDPAKVVEAIRASYASSFIAEIDGARVLGGSYDPSFTIGLVAKDAGLGLALADELGAPLRLIPLTGQVVEEARAAYGDDAGNLSTMRLYEDSAGVKFRPRTG